MTRNQTALVLAVVAVGLGVVAAIGYLSNQTVAGPVDPIETSLTATASTTTSSDQTTPPAAAKPPTWDVNETTELSGLQTTQAPTPVHLTIDALGIDAPVGAYGVDDTGLMEVPENVTEAAWYRHGPSPGEPGSAVLAAHVDLRGQGRGLFFELDELSVGDRISVSYTDGSQRAFRVVARSIYPKAELPLDAIFSRTGPPILTLVTCGGGFSRSAGSYDSNVVVYAVPSDPAPTNTSRR